MAATYNSTVRIEADVEPVASAAATLVELLHEPSLREVEKEHQLVKRWFHLESLRRSAVILILLLLCLGVILTKFTGEKELGAPIFQINVTTIPTMKWINEHEPLLSSKCMDCISKTSTAHQPGNFGISKPYWEDVLRHFKDDPAYKELNILFYNICDPYNDCGDLAVRLYNKLYRRDCNGDGLIGCRDHIMLHLLGPTGCTTEQVPYIYRERMEQCLEKLYD